MRVHSFHRLAPLVAVLALLAGSSLAWVEPEAPAAGPARAHTAGLRFTDETGAALASATVRVLCHTGPAVDPAANPPRDDVLLMTDGDGRPTRSLPAGCNYIAGLHLRHTQLSSKPGHGPAYWVYAASWNPAAPALAPTSGDVVVSRNWPLVLFSVRASLEWEPAAGSPFLAELRQGLRQASAYLYDLSEGQMAFGPVAIQTGGRGWDSADLRFRAANDARPSAHVGGVTPARRPYTTQAGVSTVYAPGEITLGRYWDGRLASDPLGGAWSNANGFRTLVHEWAHYALFLYDEYRKADGSETYCTCIDLPSVGATPAPGVCGGVPAALAASAMAYHYSASELWLRPASPPAVCQDTDQDTVHGEPDWQTLGAWGAVQGLAFEPLRLPASLTPDTDFSLAGALFGRWPAQRIYLPLLPGQGPAAAPATEPALDLSASGAFTPEELNALYPQVYLVQAGGSGPAAIIHQGTSNGPRSPAGGLGNLTLVDVRAADRVWATADRYSAGGALGARLSGSLGPSLVSGQTVQLTVDPWQASLDAVYGMSGPLLTAMTVTLASPQALATPPVAQLCLPASAAGCPTDSVWRKTMQSSGGLWQASFQAPAGSELPHYGLLHVQAAGAGELIRWFMAAGGVGPAHIEGDAPLRDGPAVVDAALATPGQRNRVIVMPAANYQALTAPLPPNIRGLVGLPLDIDVLLPGGPLAALAGRRDVAEPDRPLPAPVRITLFYPREAVERLAIREEQLRVLHFSAQQSGMWREVPLAGASQQLGWLTTIPVQEDGIYAVGWSDR